MWRGLIDALLEFPNPLFPATVVKPFWDLDVVYCTGILPCIAENLAIVRASSLSSPAKRSAPRAAASVRLSASDREPAREP